MPSVRADAAHLFLPKTKKQNKLMNNNKTDIIDQKVKEDYKYGFVTDIESETLPPGINEDTIQFISEKKKEPSWLLDWRIKAYRKWLKMDEPHWQNVQYDNINYQDISYYSSPKKKNLKSLDELDPELLKTYDKLGIPLDEQKMLNGIAVDAVFDSVSVATTFREELKSHGVIFCSFSEAAINHPDIVKKYLGTVVPYTDNYFAALNSAVFTDGSFVYIPKGVKCPMELSTYFRINEAKTGQFERTLIIADDNSHVSYLEGCTAPMRDENQLHAAENSVFNMAYTAIGTSPDGGSTYLLPRLVGRRVAMEMALLNREINAEEALRLGLVNVVVKEEDCVATANKVAEKLVLGPPHAIGEAKSLINQSLESDSLDSHLNLEKKKFIGCAGMADFREGLEAFLEKRKPNFTGSEKK